MEKLTARRFILLSLVTLLALGTFAGCASTGTGTNDRAWQQTATDGYVAVGLALNTAKATADTLVATGTIPADKKARIDAAYKIAYDSYIAAGDLLAAAIETQDAAGEKDAMAAYNAALTKLPGLVAQVTQIVAEVEAR